MEIPTPDETNDNIVAFWTPDTLPEKGQPIDVSYRLHFTTDEPNLHTKDLAWVSQTRLSTGDVRQSNLVRQTDGSLAYIIDFEGPNLDDLPEDSQVGSQVSLDANGELVENSVRYNPVTKGYRLTLRLKVKDQTKPVEMRANLAQGDKPLSETWTYHYLPMNNTTRDTSVAAAGDYLEHLPLPAGQRQCWTRRRTSSRCTGNWPVPAAKAPRVPRR